MNSTVLKLGMKFAKEFVAEYAMIKLLDGVEEMIAAKKTQGKTVEQIAQEMRNDIAEIKEAQLKCAKESIQDVIDESGQEMADKVLKLAEQHIEVWARRTTGRIDNAELALLALKDVQRNEKKYNVLFGKIASDLAEDLRKSAKQYASCMEALYGYELMMEDIKADSKEVEVDGQKYMVPSKLKYTSYRFQEMIAMVDVLSGIEEDSAINDMNILKQLAYSLDYTFEEDEKKARKKETEADTVKRFIKNQKKARESAEKLKA